MILILGAALGFISVGFGAYSEHALRPVVSQEEFRFLMTAVRYNQVHAVVSIAIGVSLLGNSPLATLKPLHWSGALFILGTLLFSFSIYLSVFFGIKSLTFITPFGGITLMAAWFMLLITGILARKKT